MRVSAIFDFLRTHPLTKNRKYTAFMRFVRWQIEYRVLQRKERIIPWLNNGNHPMQTQLILSPGRHSATANYYVGLQEYEDMALVLHALRQGDIMLDIGANIGAFTLLASSTGARVIAAEPSPDNTRYLEHHVAHNGIGAQVTVKQIGIGAEKGMLPFIEGRDSVCRIAMDGEKADIEVPVETLDDMAQGEQPTLIKIDVEGFEPAVIAGGQATLSGNSPMIVITEANGQCERYGLADSVDANLRKHGFVPCSYAPDTRTLEEVEGDAESVADNAIYVRDIAFFKERVASAPKVRIHPVDITL